VVEERWGAQLVVASDRQDDHRLLENVEQLMNPAHAFLAEIIEVNLHVMFELGVGSGKAEILGEYVPGRA